MKVNVCEWLQMKPVERYMLIHQEAKQQHFSKLKNDRLQTAAQ